MLKNNIKLSLILKNFYNRLFKTKTVGILNEHLVDYPTPSNINYLWSFGALSGFFLGIQIITGIILAMHYTPHMDYAFMSVEHIMRDVNHGDTIRYMHSNGASFFFIVTFLHIGKNLYNKAYIGSKFVLWISGLLIFILMMATAFFGYMLPWGQMSYWGATVITNLFTAIPYFGNDLAEWLWGGYSIGNPTLNRFYSFHYLCPFLIVGVLLVHLQLLHLKGSTNPLDIFPHADRVSFYPKYYLKDLLIIFCIISSFIYIVFFEPNFFSDPENYILADTEHTPHHLVPEWYFLPFYAILRGIEDKLGGFIAMGASLIIFFLLPAFDHGYMAESAKHSKIHKILFYFFCINFFALMYLGGAEIGINTIFWIHFWSISYFVVLFLYARVNLMYPVDTYLH
jgi:ubiquinol-cytochrome c reductase cytochrome b/c1 subunit